MAAETKELTPPSPPPRRRRRLLFLITFILALLLLVLALTQFGGCSQPKTPPAPTPTAGVTDTPAPPPATDTPEPPATDAPTATPTPMTEVPNTGGILENSTLVFTLPGIAVLLLLMIGAARQVRLPRR